MTKQLTRRRLLNSVSWVGLLGFTGCIAPAYRSLQFKRVEPPSGSDAELIIDVEIVATRRNVEQEAATFRDVSVVGYTATRERVGQLQVGTLIPRETRDLSLSCSARPDYLTFTINKNECEIDTNIGVVRVEPATAEYQYTTLDDKHCDGPELPVSD